MNTRKGLDKGGVAGWEKKHSETRCVHGSQDDGRRTIVKRKMKYPDSPPPPYQDPYPGKPDHRPLQPFSSACEGEYGQAAGECCLRAVHALPRRSWRSEDYAVKHKYVGEILNWLGINRRDVVEGFANDLNHRFAHYWDVQTNAFSMQWGEGGREVGHTLWMNPPFSQLDRVLLKCVLDQVEDAILIVPSWEGREFLDMFYKLAVHVKEYPVETHFFELVLPGRSVCAGPLRWRVLAGYLSYRL